MELDQHFISTGWISGGLLKAAYAISTTVVVPSQYLDPFPTVVLEAMACGKPIIGTCMGGIPEIVVDGTTGFIIGPQDFNALSLRLITTLFDYELAFQMGEKAKERVESFSLETQVQKLIRSYEKCF
jgi:glycosyltransferase involved in cell wall biosynthesis